MQRVAESNRVHHTNGWKLIEKQQVLHAVKLSSHINVSVRSATDGGHWNRCEEKQKDEIKSNNVYIKASHINALCIAREENDFYHQRSSFGLGLGPCVDDCRIDAK